MESTCIHSEKSQVQRIPAPPGHVGPWLTTISRRSDYPSRGVRWAFQFDWIGPGKPADPQWQAVVSYSPYGPGEATIIHDPVGPDSRMVRQTLDRKGGTLHAADGIWHNAIHMRPDIITILEFVLREGDVPVNVSFSCGAGRCEWSGVLKGL